MRKELFETGKTVDTAIDSACEKLGCLREDCEWEIIDLPKKGFLGLKNIPAKVRVSIEVPDEKPAKVQRPPQPEPRRQEARPQMQKPARPQQTEKPRQAETADKGRYEKQEQPQPRAFKKAEVIKPGEISEKEAAAKDYIASVLDAAGLKADFEVTREHGGSYVNIVGEGLGMVIGRRGETLDALQYLAGLVANRAEGDYLRLTVDCGDYRIKRRSTLEALARKLANQVLKTNVSRTLEPMNPFERRIIHATVSEIEGVSSSSIGDEPNRRVVITSPNAKPPARGGYRSDRDNRGDRENSRGSYGRGRGPRNASDSRGEANPRGGDNPHGGVPAESSENSRSESPRSESPRNASDSRGGERQARDNRRGPRSGDRRDDRRDDRRTDDRRTGGGRSNQAQPAPQGPPKQTPETETTAGFSFGKIEL